MVMFNRAVESLTQITLIITLIKTYCKEKFDVRGNFNQIRPDFETWMRIRFFKMLTRVHLLYGKMFLRPWTITDLIQIGMWVINICVWRVFLLFLCLRKNPKVVLSDPVQLLVQGSVQQTISDQLHLYNGKC